MLIQLIQVAIGCREKLSRSLTVFEWSEVYKQSILQAVSGICLLGLEKLPEEQRPPKLLLIEWIGLVEGIKRRNKLVDKQTKDIWQQLNNAGLKAVILKGQGIACEYGEKSEYRQSGDIDVWVKGGFKTVCDYVQITYPTDDIAYHRFHYNVFSDTEVELHHRPTLMRNLLDDMKLSKWYNGFDANKFIYLPEKGFAVPPSDFNVIFILTHIYRHFLFEGVGLRQVMDYYFVLKNHSYNLDILEIRKTLHSLRLERFASAMMWLLYSQFGLDKNKLICSPNAKEGTFLLNEVLLTGNFGQGDKRYNYKRFYKLRHQISHGCHLLLHYPSEVLWTPVWLIYHWFWKRNKKNKIKRLSK